MLKGWTITKRSFYSTFKHNRWYINSRNQFRSCSATLLSRVGWNMFFLRICCKLGQRRGSHISICKKTWFSNFLNFVLLCRSPKQIVFSKNHKMLPGFKTLQIIKFNLIDNSTNKNPMRIVASICFADPHKWLN